MLRAPVAAVLVLALLGACGGDGNDVAETRADQARQVAKDAGLSDAVQDVLATAAQSATRTFTVTYKLAIDGTTTVIQDPPRRRVELVLGPAAGGSTRATITNEDGTFACSKANDAWTCNKTAATAADAGALAVGDIRRTTADLVAARENYSFRVESRTVAKTRVRCLITELKPGRPADPTRGNRGVLCIAAEGVPLLIEGGQTKVTATAYRPEADDDAFELPAQPS